MDDSARTALDAETPVNPYSILESVNRSSRAASRGWFAFLLLLAYLAVIVAGITHRDLLLNSDVVLPLVQAKIGLTRFFTWAPIVLLVLHVGVLAQLVLLVRKALVFDEALRLLESTDRRTHPLRLELDNFFLVQSVAGPDRSRVLSAFLNGAGWMTLVLLPLLLLLYVQIAFLPFHDAGITLVHRIVVVADLAALALLGVFLLHGEPSYFAGFARAVAHNPGSLAFGLLVLGAAGFLSIFVATAPDARSDRAAFFTGSDGSLFGVLPRDLVVTDGLILAGKTLTPGRPSLSLRGRDLRNARLEGIDLRQADLRGANLDGASLAGADLRNAWLGCLDPDAFAKSQDRARGQCASARAADFSRARLDAAKLAGIHLQSARFDDARMEGADLSQGILNGASFARALLSRALLQGAAAQGAGFQQATVEGADLAGIALQLADLSGAKLQAANLQRAILDGAVLRRAEIEGADLRAARLYGADFSEARIGGADLSTARLWRTIPPAVDSAATADVASIVLKAPSDDEVGLLKAAVANLEGAPVKDRVDVRVKSLTDATAGDAWLAEPDALVWQRLARDEAGVGENYKARVSEFLAGLLCRAQFADGAVAAGIARRAAAPGFKGDAAVLHARLKGGECPAAGMATESVLRELAAAAEPAAPR